MHTPEMNPSTSLRISPFNAFFQAATSNLPYDYQYRLAGGDSGTACCSQLINIPTGLGKTAAVVLAWLWNRICLQRTDWPRRLVYCLPMRTLVEQTEKEIRKWLAAHDLRWDNKPENRKGKVGVHILMGGEDSGEWDIFPEENAILIGTQDMLLSRALNRGYGMNRYRWPMHFGLLNNDCLWVMDETQLMGPGLGTACQLEAFRNEPDQGFGSFGLHPSATWYMSATNAPELLQTREWRGISRPLEFEVSLSTEEKSAAAGPIYQRRHAVKRLELKSNRSFADSTAIQTVVAEIVRRHRDMVTAIANEPELPTRTLVICNTVDRAVAAHALLKSEKPEGCDLILLHSRFRPPERREQMKRLESVDRAAFPKEGGEGIGEPGFTPDFQRDELCPVPISKISKRRDPKATEVLSRGWLWRGKESGWVSVRDSGLAAGMTILLPREAGGYDKDAGWTGDKNDHKHTPHYDPRETPSDEEQLSSLANGWQSIAVHTDAVAQELRELLRHLLLNEEAERSALTVSWHDIGKNHPGWQQAVIDALKEAGITGKDAHLPFAKFSLSDSPRLRNDSGSLRFTGRELAR